MDGVMSITDDRWSELAHTIRQVLGYGDDYSEVNLSIDDEFKHTDEDLIQFYLHPKITNSPFPSNGIQQLLDLYDHHPHDICCQNHDLVGDDACYFFTLRKEELANGIRPNQGGNGYWKPTGADVKISIREQEIGRKKVFVYYEGMEKDRSRVMTNWIMHEYRINQTAPTTSISTNSSSTMVDYNWVLCRIYYRKPTGLPPLDIPSLPLYPLEHFPATTDQLSSFETAPRVNPDSARNAAKENQLEATYQTVNMDPSLQQLS